MKLSKKCCQKLLFIFTLVAVHGVYGACSDNRAHALPSVVLQVGSQSVEVELALRPEEQAKGLMYREALAEMRGMLFSFPQDRILRFYMKNTLVPLTIAYLDKTGTIRELHDMQALDERTVASEWPLRFALEMNQGWFARYGVRIGERVTFKDGSPLEHAKLLQLAFR